MELPVLVIPGMNADTIAVAVGYGRADTLGVAAAGVGKTLIRLQRTTEKRLIMWQPELLPPT